MSWIEQAEVTTKADKEEREKAKQRAQIIADFKAEIAPVVDGYDEQEMKSWPFQVEEARKVKDGNSSNALEWMVNGRGKGETQEAFADKILQKRQAFESVFWPALSKKQKRLSELDDK